MANTPLATSPETQQLIAAAGQAAADDAAAQSKLVTDQKTINDLGQQLTVANAQLAADQTDASRADFASNSAFIAACQSLAADFKIPLPQTIPVPPPPIPMQPQK